MADDEEKQLRLELLAADLKLRRKQEFWETPRNIAILVGVSAAIAAAIGFWLGRESATPPAPLTSPVFSLGYFDKMRGSEFIDAIQTAGIIVHRGSADLCGGPAGAGDNDSRQGS